MTLIPRKSASSSTIVKKILSENISALKLVSAINLTEIKVSEPDTFENSKVIGIAIEGGTTGEKKKILEFGELADAFFTFALNVPLFLGLNGVVTDAPQSVGFNVTIGHSLGSGAIFIDIQEPIEL
jgi:hypothetical protein